jgi:hypothetical protein
MKQLGLETAKNRGSLHGSLSKDQRKIIHNEKNGDK